MPEFQVIKGGAFENINGKRIEYDIVGPNSLPAARSAPEFRPMTLVDPLDPNTRLSFSMDNLRHIGKSIFYVVNGLATIECQKGAQLCQTLSRVPARGVYLSIVSNEDPDELLKLASAQGLTIPILSTAATKDHPESDFGKQYGLHLKDPNDPKVDGMLMRSLLVFGGSLRLKRQDPVPLLARMRIRNQGGPQPNFQKGIEIAQTAILAEAA